MIAFSFTGAFVARQEKKWQDKVFYTYLFAQLTPEPTEYETEKNCFFIPVSVSNPKSLENYNNLAIGELCELECDVTFSPIKDANNSPFVSIRAWKKPETKGVHGEYLQYLRDNFAHIFNNLGAPASAPAPAPSTEASPSPSPASPLYGVATPSREAGKYVRQRLSTGQWHWCAAHAQPSDLDHFPPVPSNAPAPQFPTDEEDLPF